MPESVASVEWRKFIEASSVRGLKRTISSPTVLQRVFWIGFLLCSVAAMATQGYFIIQNYLSLKDISMLRSRSNFGQSASFPSVTLCNRNMLNPRKDRGQISIANYSARIRNLAKQASNMKETEELLNMDKLHGYYAQLPHDSIKNYTVELQDVAILINLVYNNGSRQTVHKNFKILDEFQRQKGRPVGPERQIETSDSIFITKFYHPEFSLCHSLHLNISDESIGELKALRIDLAMASKVFNTCIDSISRDSRGFLVESLSTLSDFVIVLHDRDVYPLNLVAQRGITVRPGGITAVRFNMQNYIYRQCKSDARISHGRLGSFRHTTEDCSDNIVESWLNRRLNCTDDTFAFSDRQGCLKIPDSNSYTDMLTRLRKYVLVRQEALDSTELSNECNLPSCKETHYGTSYSYSPWLINDFQWKWAIHKLLTEGQGTLDYLEYAENDTFIEQPAYVFNEYKGIMRTVNVYRENSYVTINEEVELTTVSNLISSVGGTMSIYVGITFTLVAEFLDFVFCLGRALALRKGKHADDRVFSMRGESVDTVKTVT